MVQASAPSGDGTSRGSRSARWWERRQVSPPASGRLFREPQHRVLHDVERGFLVAHREHRLLELALLDALQEAESRSGMPGSLCCFAADGIKRPRRGAPWLDRTHQAFIVQKLLELGEFRWIALRRLRTGAETSCATSRRRASSTSSAIPAGGAVHLRRALQAGQGQHVGAPRAGRGARRRRLLALLKKVGVCLVTSGPGMTNAVTGIATAYMESIPWSC